MIAELTILGIDVSRDWLDGFFLPGQERFRHPNTAEGHIALISKLQHLSGQVKVGFEATGGQEWGLWRELVAAGIAAVQLPPAHTLSDASIACRAMDQGLRAISGHACEDRPDRSLPGRACLHAREGQSSSPGSCAARQSFALQTMKGVFRPEAGRELPGENFHVLRTLTTRRGQLVDMRKRFISQTKARKKQGIPADVETLDDDLQAVLNAQIDEVERRIESVIAHVETFAVKAGLLRSIPPYGHVNMPSRAMGIGPVSAAMLIAELPELGQMTAGEAAAMTGLAPVSRDSGMMRGQRTIVGGRRSLRHVLFQAALAAACHNPVLKPVAKRLKERGKPHKLVIVAIARRLVTIANAIIKTGIPWQIQLDE